VEADLGPGTLRKELESGIFSIFFGKYQFSDLKSSLPKLGVSPKLDTKIGLPIGPDPVLPKSGLESGLMLEIAKIRSSHHHQDVPLAF
jgi:hypothetical protein